MLEDLEKVMPPRLHLVSINPQLDDDNQLALKMMVAGSSRDRAIELTRRMEESRRFAQTTVLDERPIQSTTGDTIQFDIGSVYLPGNPIQMAEPADSVAKPAKRSKP